MPKITQGVGAAIFSSMAYVGENMQKMAISKMMDYNWAVGHLSDIGASGLLTALVILPSTKLKHTVLASLIIPVYYSILEVISLNSANACIAKYDFQDLMCYFAGATIAVGIKLASEQSLNKTPKLEVIVDNSRYKST